MKPDTKETINAMSRHRGIELDIIAYLYHATPASTHELENELAKLTDTALEQLWLALKAGELVARRIDDAYWDGVQEGESITADNAKEEGREEGRKEACLAWFSNEEILDEVKQRQLTEQLLHRSR